MVKAGSNDLRGHLLQAMVQRMSQKSSPFPQFGERMSGLGKGVSTQNRLQQLVQRIGAGFPGQPEGGAAPAAAPTGHAPQAPVDPVAHALSEQRDPAPYANPGFQQHLRGNDTAGAQMYMDRHPAAAMGRASIPDWVLEGLTNAANQGGMHPNHIQEILGHLSQALSKGAPVGAQAPAPGGPGGATPHGLAQ